MKSLIVMTTVLLWGMSCFAETRIIGVQVQKATNATIQVTISSDVKEENRANLTVKQAHVILQNAKGWGSTVLVGVEAHGVSLSEYFPLLEAISESMWLELVFVEGATPWMSPTLADLRALVVGPTLERAWQVWSDGHCPACSTDVRMYEWRVAGMATPWKVSCPRCDARFPTNDFESYYCSGLDASGLFRAELADRSLLVNAAHPDTADALRDFGVDGELCAVIGDSAAGIHATIRHGLLEDPLANPMKTYSNFAQRQVAEAVFRMVLAPVGNRDAVLADLDLVIERSGRCNGSTGEKGMQNYTAFATRGLTDLLTLFSEMDQTLAARY